MDGCPRSESNKGPSLDSQSHMRSKRYSSLEFCIWHVLLYSVIIEVYIYVTVLATLNTSYNNNIIVKHFRGLVLGLKSRPKVDFYSCTSHWESYPHTISRFRGAICFYSPLQRRDNLRPMG